MPFIALILGFGMGTLTDKGMKWLSDRNEPTITDQRIILLLLTGMSFYLTIDKFGVNWFGLKTLVLVSLLIPAAFIDLKWQIIPNKLILLGIIAGVFVIVPQGYISVVLAAKGLFGGLLLMLVMFILSLGRLGGGDIKFTALIGLFVGWGQVLLVIIFAYLFGGLTSLFLLVTRQKKFSDPLPMGPFISLATLTTVFWGKSVLTWYLKLYS